jgi:hypothetical protein
LGIRIQTIKRLEVVEGIPQGRVQTLLDIKSALEVRRLRIHRYA